MTTLEMLIAQAKQAVLDGTLPPEQRPGSRGQLISFAYGNAVLSNPDVTREMVERAVDEHLAKKAAK